MTVFHPLKELGARCLTCRACGLSWGRRKEVRGRPNIDLPQRLAILGIALVISLSGNLLGVSHTLGHRRWPAAGSSQTMAESPATRMSVDCRPTRPIEGPGRRVA